MDRTHGEYAGHSRRPSSLVVVSVPSLTLDTSVVLVGPTEIAADAVAELFRRAQAGDFDIALCSRVDFQTKRPLADERLAAFIAELPRILPTGRWADPASDDLPTDTWDNFVWAGEPEPRPDASAGDRLDDDILEAHQRSQRDHFVTLDIPQRKRALAIGISALTPAELLGRYPTQ
jgi:hypothetical protein